MSGPKNPDDYYDNFFDRKRASAWWRITGRYCAAVLVFLMLMTGVLSAWWIWEDYTLSGYEGVTWANFSRRAAYRFDEFAHGRLGLDEVFCRFYHC